MGTSISRPERLPCSLSWRSRPPQHARQSKRLAPPAWVLSPWRSSSPLCPRSSLSSGRRPPRISRFRTSASTSAGSPRCRISRCFLARAGLPSRAAGSSFYARYLDWMITFPLITILLGQIAGCEWTVIFGAIGSQLIQLFAQYMGSVSTVTTVKWLWFILNLAGLAGVLAHLARVFKAGADSKGGEVAQLYGKVGWMTILVWSCYPIVWLFSEGFASFSVSFEITMYAILDVINKVVLCFMVMSAQDAVAGDDMGNREYV